MTRPTLEVADILRVQGDRFLESISIELGESKLYLFPTRTLGRSLDHPISDKTVWIAGSEAGCYCCTIRNLRKPLLASPTLAIRSIHSHKRSGRV